MSRGGRSITKQAGDIEGGTLNNLKINREFSAGGILKMDSLDKNSNIRRKRQTSNNSYSYQQQTEPSTTQVQHYGVED